MHPTTDVRKKDRPPFDKISEDMYQSNVLKQLFYRETARKRELLPATLYKKEKLGETLQELKEKGLVRVMDKSDRDMFELTEKTMNNEL